MLTQAEYKRLKSRLTRKLNAHRREQTVASACALQDEARHGLDYFDAHGYPDEWHRWQVAREDAVTFLLHRR